MSCGRFNWQLLLECAESLDQRGLSPFTRTDLIAGVQARHPERARASLDPTIQGMSRGASGGPRPACGEAFERVGHGLYRLLSHADRSTADAVTSAPTGVMPQDESPTPPPPGVATSIRRPRRSGRKAEEIARRLAELVEDFPGYVALFDREVPFTATGQYDSHRRTIDQRRALGGVGAALDDDDFLRSLYDTLGRWRLGTRASQLLPMDQFAAALRARKPALEAAEELDIEDHTLDLDRLAGRVWWLVAGLPITGNVARIVAATKTLHHLLPELVPPMDRRWTGAFFMWSTVDPQSRQYQTFWLTYRDLVAVAQKVRPSQYVGDGWKTSATKVLDNALVGYGRHHNLGP